MARFFSSTPTRLTTAIPDAQYSFSNQQFTTNTLFPITTNPYISRPVIAPNLLISTLPNPPSTDPSSSALPRESPNPSTHRPHRQQPAMAMPFFQSKINTTASSHRNSKTSTTTNTSPQSASNKRKEMASPPVVRSQTQGKKRAVSVLVSSSTQEAVESAFKDGSERESWLVSRLNDSSIYLPLQATRKKPKGSLMPPKSDIYRQLAEEFNKKQFAIQHSKGVYRTASNGNGIKNKIYRLQAAFKAAHTLQSSSGFGSTESESWKATIESECSCYFELLPVWGRKWSNGVVHYADSTMDLKGDFITDDPPRKDIDSDTGAEAEEEDQEDKDESEYQASLNWEDESDCNGDFDGVDGTWSQEEEDEPLVRSRRLSVPAAARSRIYTARSPAATSQRTNHQQEQQKTADGDPSSSTRMPKKPKSSKREVTDAIKELIEAIRVSALLEYQKAEIQERVRMKEIESRLKEKELDFKLRLAEIEARKAEAIAKVQAEMEIALQRECLMSERESDVVRLSDPSQPLFNPFQPRSNSPQPQPSSLPPRSPRLNLGLTRHNAGHRRLDPKA